MLVKHLPADSATVRKASESPAGWTVEAYLIADLFHAFTGEPHPSRPTTSKGGRGRYAEKRAALEAQRRRLAAQKEAPSV